jgi:uncharacterized protein
MNNFKTFEIKIAEHIRKICSEIPDASHDFLHVQRVVNTAKALSLKEGAKLEVVIPSAYLHDIVYIPKNDPRRKESSRISAKASIEFLKEINYPHHLFDEIHHAIESHSFSANIQALTLEAKIVQDADRLDGIGAIGIMRCFSLGGHFNRPFYNSNDPFSISRIPNDQNCSLDHFFVKLLKVPDMLQTTSGREEGKKRLLFMKDFLNHLNDELMIPDHLSDFIQK